MAPVKKKSKTVTFATTTTSIPATSTALPSTADQSNSHIETRANYTVKLKVPSIGLHLSTPHGSAVEKDKGHGDDIAKDYAARRNSLSDGQLYLVCKYQALLMLAFHKTMPFVYLDHPNIVRELDDFHNGYLNEDGLEMQHSLYRDMSGMKYHLDTRLHVAVRLAERIVACANANFTKEAKNRIIDGKNPEHAAFTRVIVSAKQFEDWCAIVKNPRYIGALDFPERSPLVKNHLFKVIAEQYNFNTWHHFPPEPKFNQVVRLTGEGMSEEFQYTADHPYMILGVIDVTIPGTNKRFFQMDVFSDLRQPMKAKRNKAKNTEVFYLPCPDVFIIPKPLTSARWAGRAKWVVADWNPKLWIRADGKEWLARFGTRMFDNKTKEYVMFCHPDPAWLANVNPNDEEWRRKYNDFFHKLGGRCLEEEEDAEGVEGDDVEMGGVE